MMGQGDDYDYDSALRANRRAVCGVWEYEEAIDILEARVERLRIIVQRLVVKLKSNKRIHSTCSTGE